MNVLDLFSGIGGFSLGLERAGMRTVAFCEIEPFVRAVLAKHWPDVPCHGDITTREFVEGEADVICGGFPCQDISNAGDRTGLAGERSGLWRELLRAIRVVRPRFAIVENVAALLARGMGRVLGDLAEIGYDAEWHCIPAAAVGAPHRRDRVWIVANADGGRWPAGQPTATSMGHGHSTGTEGGDVSDTPSDRRFAWRPMHPTQEQGGWQPYRGSIQPDVANALGARLEGCPILAGYIANELAAIERGCEVLHADSAGPSHPAFGEIHCGEEGPRPRHGESQRPNWWLIEPDVGRVAHGVPSRVDRLKGLGNAVVPQIPEIIGRAIMRSIA